MGDGGVLKTNFLKESIQHNLVLVGWGDSKQNTFHGRGLDIFCNNTIFRITFTLGHLVQYVDRYIGQ